MASKALVVFVLCLSIAVPATAGTWLDRRPDRAGRLSAIVADPGDPNVLVVASPGGGVWRTRDGGATWQQPLNYALADFSVVHLEWDRIRPGRLFASTLSDLYASTDLGDHWSNLTASGGYPAPLLPASPPADPRPFAQLRHSRAERTVFWSRPCSGLFYSHDGATFTQTWPFPGGASNPDNCLVSIAADDASGRVYFSTAARGGTAHLFRSTCGWTAGGPCLSWEAANLGLPTNAVVSSLAWTGGADRLVAASAPSSSTLVYTTSDGRNWVPTTSAPPTTSWDPRPLAVPAAHQILVGTVVAYQSTDGGGSWDPIFYSGMHPDVRSFHWASYPNGSYLWLTTDGSSASGLYAAISRWSFTPGSAPTGGTTVGVSGLKTWQAFVFAVTGIPGGQRRRAFLGSLDNGALCSDDGGVTWTSAGAPPGGGCGDYPSIVIAPGRPDRVYARTCSSTSFARSDNAFSAPTCADVVWQSISPAAGHYTPYLWTNAMTGVHPTDPNRVVFARSLDLGFSSDGGGSFTLRNLPDGAQPVSVFLDSRSGVYVGTLDHGIYRTRDGGATWTPFGLNAPAPRAVLEVAWSSAGGRGGTFFAATTNGLYRKLPGGAWTRQTPDPAYTVSDVKVDPHCPTRVYAALGYAGPLGGHRGGILLSNDNGTTFTSITSGLDIHQAPISDVQVDPLSPRYLHAAVYGLGAWSYDAGSPPACR